MPVTQLDRDNPWPGLESFEEDARDYFHGREAEADELLRRVADAPLTVLFGKSGLGKTSLLKAGLFPRLREKHFLPVHVRLDIRPDAPALIDQLRRRPACGDRARGASTRHPSPRAKRSGSTCTAPIWSCGASRTTRSPRCSCSTSSRRSSRSATGSPRRWLGARSTSAISPRTASRGARGPAGGGRLDGAALDLRRMPYKLVVTLREDFLPHLEGWRAAVPSLGRVRVRLLPMRPEQALSAVYDTAPHLMDEPLARRIVEFVAAAQISQTPRPEAADPAGRRCAAEIEPALLQPLLPRAQRTAQAPGHGPLRRAAPRRRPAGHHRGLLPLLRRRPARQREPVHRDRADHRKGFPQQLCERRRRAGPPHQEQLDRLINRRLLRLEERYGTARIELTHQLTRVVREARDRLRQEDALLPPPAPQPSAERSRSGCRRSRAPSANARSSGSCAKRGASGAGRRTRRSC